MKKLFALLLALSMLLSLAACGGSATTDPNAGLYEGKYGEASGFQVPITSMWEDGFSIELKTGGKGTINVGGTSGSIKWTLDGTSLHIEGTGLAANGVVLDGTLENGVMDLKNVLDQGVDIHLECAEILQP
ncbi:MAG: hypothetical protein IK095_03855 [Oscillospiraceae bacterium]|nr:hypothetical protein [Oscillospiraceae bacterium]